MSLDLPNNLKATWQIRQTPVFTVFSLSLMEARYRFNHLNVMSFLLKLADHREQESESRNAVDKASRNTYEAN